MSELRLRENQAPAVDPQSERDAIENRARVEDAVRALVGKLENEAQSQRGRRQLIEDRWYADLRAYYGRYESKVEADLKAAEKSRLYVQLTRSKTNGWEARLSDMLFPTDDKNWGIEPTPVPQLEAALHSEDDEQRERAKQLVDAAKERSNAMEQEIEDQLKESRYNIQVREALHDGCKLGTGVMKGPTVTNRTKRAWRRHEGQGGQVLHELEVVSDARPEMKRVNPWYFYPDMSATTLEEAEFTFELHLDTRKQLQKLARNPGVNLAAIRRLLKHGPEGGTPPYIPRLRQITQAGDDAALTDRYWRWEYHGPISIEDMRMLLQASEDDSGLRQLEDEHGDLDPLAEINVIIQFCQGEVLQFGPHPMDSGDHLYSVWNFEKDDSSIFGMGVPYLMRDSQDSLNGAWRMMMDNGALSAGPQVIIDKNQVEPADGSWKLTPRKIWHRIQSAVGTTRQPVFETYDIPSNQEQLAGIVEMSRQFADDETNFPRVAQGESGAQQTTTAQGMAMLMNSVNVIFRRTVRQFDDDMTTPNITRMYDWNMQFSKKQNIKGDYEVVARGSSVLLVRDIQAQNLMVMAIQFTQNALLAPMIKILPMLRKLVQANMLPPDEIIKTEEEVQADLEKAKKSKANEGPDPEELKIQAQIEIANMENATTIKVAEIRQNTELMKLAEQMNMKVDEVRAKFLGEQQKEASTAANTDKKIASDQVQTDKKIASDERQFAAEVAVKERFGEGI